MKYYMRKALYHLYSVIHRFFFNDFCWHWRSWKYN